MHQQMSTNVRKLPTKMSFGEMVNRLARLSKHKSMDGFVYDSGEWLIRVGELSVIVEHGNCWYTISLVESHNHVPPSFVSHENFAPVVKKALVYENGVDIMEMM